MARKPARAARLWGAAALVVGASLMVAAPATAATTSAKPASPVATTTSTLQVPTMHPPQCIGQELALSWTVSDGATGYRILADGVWVAGTSNNIYNFYGWDRGITFTVRAIDESGHVSPESNGVKNPCQPAG